MDSYDDLILLEFEKMEAQKKSYFFKNAPKELRDHEEVVKRAISINPFSIQFVSLRLKKKKEINQLAIQRNPRSLFSTHSAMQYNKELVTLAVKIDPSIYRDLPFKMRKDIDVLISSCTYSNENVHYTCSSCKNQKKLFDHCIHLYDFHLEPFGQKIKKDPKKIESIFPNHFRQFQYANPILKKDKNFILHLIKTYAVNITCYIANELKDDDDIANFSIKYIPYNPIQYLSSRIQSQRKYMTNSFCKTLNLNLLGTKNHYMDYRNIGFHIKHYEDCLLLL